MNAFEIETTQVFEQRLDRKEASGGRCLTKRGEPRQSVPAVLHAHTCGPRIPPQLAEPLRRSKDTASVASATTLVTGRFVA